MKVIKKTAIVPYRPKQMFNLVNDVTKYPEFLPWCGNAEISMQDEDELRAVLHVQQGAFNKSFSTCNRLKPHKMIEMKLLDGPFKHLEGFWAFEPLQDQGSKVNFHLEFEFSNRLMSMAMNPVFSQMANTILDCFCERAQHLYK